jgi:(S)-sulfolactate dehydrogenase
MTAIVICEFIDEDAHRGVLAGLDVFAGEPLSAQQFAGCRNPTLTPHIAGLTVESSARVSRLVAETIRDHLGGAP